MLNQTAEKISSSFGERLIEALEFQGITDSDKQVEKVAKACGVNIGTARKYLQTTYDPVYVRQRHIKLAQALEVRCGWLILGEGFGPSATHVAKAMDAMTEWERTKYLRFAIRLHNNDAKARRLGDMCVAGQISRNQLLSMM